MNLTLKDAAQVMGGTLSLVDSGRRITGAVADSRLVRPGDVFFALEGEWRDGHDFVTDAFHRGASAAVVSRKVSEANGPQILVTDPLGALVTLAGWVRDVLDPLVAGISGSTGKTSVKDLLRSITSRQMATVASQRSFNNEIGVPLTLLATKTETRLVICEMGARGGGQISRLCDLARPQLGVVTNVGVTHYEQFGSQEAIAAAKSELVQSLPEDGAAVLNADDPLVMEMASRTAAEVFTFGVAEEGWIRASDVRIDQMGRPTFKIIRGRDSVWLTMPVSGNHQVPNALAASAAAMALGLSLEDCRVGLESAVISEWRMQVELAGGVVFVNDAYNSNPTSVASALTSCAAMAADRGRLLAVLGYMAELGEREVLEHRRAGALAASLASRLVVVGGRASPIAEGAIEAGMEDVTLVEDDFAAVEAAGELRPGDVFLVKGSRVAALEKVVEMAKARVGV